MNQPDAPRGKNITILLDFTLTWALLNNVPLTDYQRQLIFFRIFESMELDVDRVLQYTHRGQHLKAEEDETDAAIRLVPFDQLTQIVFSCYNLVTYNNLFELEVPDDANGLIREFPWGCPSVNSTTLWLTCEQLQTPKHLQSQLVQFTGNGLSRPFS